MTKEELIQSISFSTGISKTGINAVIKALIDEIHKQDKLYIPGLGTFKHVVRAARTARNPITGEPVNVPEKTVLKFRPSK